MSSKPIFLLLFRNSFLQLIAVNRDEIAGDLTDCKVADFAQYSGRAMSFPRMISTDNSRQMVLKLVARAKGKKRSRHLPPAHQRTAGRPTEARVDATKLHQLPPELYVMQLPFYKFHLPVCSAPGWIAWLAVW